MAAKHQATALDVLQAIAFFREQHSEDPKQHAVALMLGISTTALYMHAYKMAQRGLLASSSPALPMVLTPVGQEHLAQATVVRTTVAFVPLPYPVPALPRVMEPTIEAVVAAQEWTQASAAAEIGSLAPEVVLARPRGPQGRTAAIQAPVPLDPVDRGGLRRIVPAVDGPPVPPRPGVPLSIEAFNYVGREHRESQGETRAGAREIYQQVQRPVNETLQVQRQVLHLRVLESDEHELPRRPRTRGECVDVPRPCPFTSCKHHMYLDVDPRNGSITYNFPDVTPDQMPAAWSCVLDIADRVHPDELKLEDVGLVMGFSRERARQLEATGVAKYTEDAEFMEENKPDD